METGKSLSHSLVIVLLYGSVATHGHPPSINIKRIHLRISVLLRWRIVERRVATSAKVTRCVVYLITAGVGSWLGTRCFWNGVRSVSESF
jgi:hypothetical protein